MVTPLSRINQQGLVLQPNRSASWHQTKLLLMLVAGFVLIIAVLWSLVGAWLILPFAGLEVGLLSWLMYKVCYATYDQQVITLDAKHVRVSVGVNNTRVKAVLQRPHAHLMVIEPGPGDDKIHLHLTDEQTQLEIGQFLTQQERELARQHIRALGLMECRLHWWKS